MGVARKFRIQWGRSYNAVNDETSVEFCHVRLPVSRDITIYLGATDQILNYPNLNKYTISVGNGGTTFDLDLQAQQVCSCVHVIAQELHVRGTIYRGLLSPPDSSMRFQAQAALGRPSRMLVRGDAYDGFRDNGIHAGNAPTAFRVVPFATQVQIDVTKSDPADPDPLPNAQIAEGNINPGGELIGDMRPAADFATPRSLYPTTNAIFVQNTAASGAFRVTLSQWIVC